MPEWGYEWGNGWGDIEPAFDNPSFEIAGDSPGQAASWTLSTSVAAWEVSAFTNVDGVLIGFEDFTVSSGADDPLTGATFGIGGTIESFEKLWGPFDGSDPSFPTLVPDIGYPENAGFLFALGQAEDIIFHPFGDSFDDFEWSVEVGLLEQWDDDVDAEAAEFDGAVDAESFEEGWGNTDYLFELTPVDATSATFGLSSPVAFESFEDAIEFDDVVRIVSAEVDQTYKLILNGVTFSFLFLAGDEATIASGLIADVSNSSSKFTAATWDGNTDTIGVRVEDVNLSLTTKITGPTIDSVALISKELRQDYWLLPDKTV